MRIRWRGWRAWLVVVAATGVARSVVDEKYVREARGEGFLVNAWTVNHVEEARRLARLGVDEITSDFPDLALRAVG